MTPRPSILSRCSTVHHQWEFIQCWIDDCALFQDGIDWILFNDAPDDPCQPSLKRKILERGILLIEPPFNHGRSNARNYCYNCATTFWVEFIDGDDIPLPLSLEYLYRFQEENLLHYRQQNYSYVNGVVKPASGVTESAPMCPGLLKNLEHIQCRPASLIYPKSLLQKAGGFDGRFDTIEDLHLLWKIDQMDPKAVSFEESKQLYRISGGPPRSDWDYQSLHKIRFFRTVISDPHGKNCLAARFWLESNGIQAAGMLLSHLHSNYAKDNEKPPEYLSAAVLSLRDYSEQLFWIARKLWLKSGANLITRIREAMKLILGI